ncbi:MAG TPA: copper resistance system multicopper oxidase [Steroidobacteraceae bacterium]
MPKRPTTLAQPGAAFAGISRRLFVHGCGAIALAASGRRALGDSARSPAVLRGAHFDLEIGSVPVNFTGRPRTATVVNGQIPAPLLRFRAGDLISVRVRNRLPTRSSIHWHGLLLPANMDGVPGLSFDGIDAGSTFVYEFRAQQSGTYWYHSHSRFQEQTGLYGPIIIDPARGERHLVERDYVVLLSDWTDADPEHIYATLKRDSEYFNFARRTVRDFFNDARSGGWREALAERRMWGEVRMDPTDLVDVSGYAYTYLMNGVTPAGNWTGEFQRGERVKLRFINGSSMSFFDVRIPGLAMTVVAADGQDVDAVSVDEFRIGAGEVYDVIVQPPEEAPYTIFAQSMDGSGYARGTLAPRAGMRAAVPAMDPRPLLSMSDMGMREDMDMARIQPRHEGNVGVDMRVATPDDSLADPGVGLRANGRRVLSYADLHTLGGALDTRPAGREIELHLTGHMQRFMWSFDGRKFSEALPLEFLQGERLRIVLVNDSMMTHPIHLHGMWSEIESRAGAFQLRKHTVLVRPAQKLSYCVSALTAGRWAFHCHLLYHMEAGMFREVTVAPAAS